MNRTGKLKRHASKVRWYCKTPFVHLSEEQSVTMLRNEREPQRFLEDEISVSAPLEQELLAIRMRGRDPNQLVKIVNAVRDSYIANVLEDEKRQNYQRFTLLQADLKSIEDDLENKNEEYVALQKQMNAADLATVKFRYDGLMQQKGQLLDESSRTREELGKVEMRIEMVKNQQEKGANVPDYLVDLNLSRDEDIARYNRAISELEMMIDQETAVARKTKGNQTIQYLQKQIASTRNRKDQRTAELKPAIIKHLASEMLKDNNGQELSDPDQLEIKRQKPASRLRPG